MNLRRLLATCALLLAVPTLPAAAELDCPNISCARARIPQAPRGPERAGTEIERRAIESYLHRLDTSRSLMLDKESTDLGAKLTGVFENLQAGNYSQIMTVHERLIALQLASEAHAKALVADENFKLDETIEIRIDPDQRGYPKSEDERNELWRKLVHFQMSNYIGAGEKLPEAKRLLAYHRYELRNEATARAAAGDLLDLPRSVRHRARPALELSLARGGRGLPHLDVAVARGDRRGALGARRIPSSSGSSRRRGRMDRAGPEPNDKIIAVAEDGESVNIVDMPLREAVSLIRGKKGTKVHLTVLRQGDETQRFPLAIVRDKIDLAEQAASLRFETRERHGKPFKLAIIDRPRSTAIPIPASASAPTTSRSCSAGEGGEGRRPAARPLAQRRWPARARREDLGLLHPQGRGRRRAEPARLASVLSDRDERILYTGPMVVHVSRVGVGVGDPRRRAQGLHRAVITGDDHTFGKGTVQTVTPLPPGLGALKITTARFFRPGGQSTQNDGVASTW